MLSDSNTRPSEIIQHLDLVQDADTDQVKTWVTQVVTSMPDKVTEYRKGKKGLIGMFVGEVKKVSKGKADPKMVTQLLESILNEK